MSSRSLKKTKKIKFLTNSKEHNLVIATLHCCHIEFIGFFTHSPQQGQSTFFFSADIFLLLFLYITSQARSCFCFRSSQHSEHTTMSKHGCKTISQGRVKHEMHVPFGTLGELVLSSSGSRASSSVASSSMQESLFSGS